MKERLIELMQLLKCTPTQFANAIGVQRATLQHILNGRNEPSIKIIKAIHEGFPNVELEWLLYGKGNAFGEVASHKPETPDYPLFPGMENTVFQPQGKDNSGFQNVREEKEPVPVRKKTVNKEINTIKDTIQNSTAKRIKEVVVFFEDGTYQKFSGELKN